jgi:SAM-dependent methyltransferase
VDRDARFEPDLLHDLDELPWPLPADRFDGVLCHHILEHLRDADRTLAEIHRVARHGARVEIVTPHFSSVNSWDDPTHVHHFSSASFDGHHANFRILHKRLGFGRALLNGIPRMISRRSLRWYEKHIAFIFPARNLTIELEVVKR